MYIIKNTAWSFGYFSKIPLRKREQTHAIRLFTCHSTKQSDTQIRLSRVYQIKIPLFD